MGNREKEPAEWKKDTVLVPQEESVRIQYVKRMKENIISQREAEEELLEQMMEEQKIVDELNKSLDENLLKTVELRKYNQEVREHMENQVYRMNGITPDKMEGMKNYRKAFYIGSAFAIFVLSVVMVAITGITHGFQSEISLFLAYFTALEGAVLITETKRVWAVRAIFRVIYFLLFPAMMVIFVCYELGYPEYGRFLPYFSMAGMVVFILAMISYFVYDPYRRDKANIRKAKDQMRNIQRAAEKSVRKNRRAIEKTERREERKAARKEARAQRQAEKAQLEKEWGAATEEVSGVGLDVAKAEEAVTEMHAGKTEAEEVRTTAENAGINAVEELTEQNVEAEQMEEEAQIAETEQIAEETQIVEAEQVAEEAQFVETEQMEEEAQIVETEQMEEEAQIAEQEQKGIIKWFRRSRG